MTCSRDVSGRGERDTPNAHQIAANVYVDDERVARVMQTTGCGEIEARFMLDLHDGKVDGDVLDERGDDA